ncbi:MAG TPA: sigma-70 family RNA polymerase sigma factor [Chryseolinea sp.]|nr:sigma-70 family RNA polymerase sigma factor [Chryseolinea sp.]
MVTSLLVFSRRIDLEVAEDIVQDAFSSAVVEWQRVDPPQNPAGWIYRVCRNKAINWINGENRRTGSLISGLPCSEIVESEYSESKLEDYQLKLLFACAHPALAPKAQVVITLKYVANLKVEAIARALAMTVDGIDRILVRSRLKLTEEKIQLDEPDASLLRLRLPIVHKVLYLIFNEGYRSSSGRELIRSELCEDALIMCRSLIEGDVGNHETKALYSLMLLNSARFGSRFDAKGNIVDLEHQDRTVWNVDLIRLGQHYLNQSIQEEVSAYHTEASIACLHCAAPSFRRTDWAMIAKLYTQLLRNNPNPFVEVNRAIALYYSDGKDEAFRILEDLHQHPFFHQYFPLTSTLGKLHGLEGRRELARQFLTLALTQAKLDAEKKFVSEMMEAL